MIPKLRFHEPRRNLPAISSRKNVERDFTLAFARAYLSQIDSLHHGTTRIDVDFAREIPMNGFGIADFVAVFWDPVGFNKNKPATDGRKFIKTASPIIRAFEIKMSNWRRALAQAHRYKYFADVSIAVLPNTQVTPALDYLNTFKAVNVGLWSFDSMNNRISTHFTPRPVAPLEPKFKPRAIELVARASKSCSLGRTTPEPYKMLFPDVRLCV